MKTLSIYLLISLSFPTFADANSFSLFSKWMDKVVPSTIGMTITLEGQTPQGIPCKVYATRHTEKETFYLSLAVGPELENHDSPNNHYFGSFVTPRARLEMKQGFIRLLHSGKYFESMTLYNNVDVSVDVELDENQVPYRASGQSTLVPEKQICLLGPALVS